MLHFVTPHGNSPFQEIVQHLAVIVDAQPLALQHLENEEAIHGILPPS